MPLQPRARKVAYSISVISAGACRPPLAPTLQSASESLAPRSGCPADPSARCTCGTPSWTGYSRAPQRAEARKRARPSGCVLASSLAAIFPAESGDARLVELSAPSLSCSSSFVNSPHARLPGMVCVAVAVLALAATACASSTSTLRRVKRQSLSDSATQAVEGLLDIAQSVLAGNATGDCNNWVNSLQASSHCTSLAHAMQADLVPAATSRNART
ncbi:hypothetical protein DMC30DRAFT_393746 [Rhodotorula diobovata]|uniref:Uncharacterized protein n=1 Tax=Rhodotorula diobovata TaxID=5288 RepID=A0A5C5FZ61_9BASI|nr:hypothetical protein DMC30DRAFT_393746 [Rhodotorula diobovata]